MALYNHYDDNENQIMYITNGCDMSACPFLVLACDTREVLNLYPLM